MSQAVETDDRTDELTPTTDEDATVSILTHGDPIRSLAKLLTPIVNEVRVQFDEHGLHAKAVDPANVALVDLTAHAQGFENFEVQDSLTFGLNLDTFTNAVSWARKRGGDGDPVAIDVYDDPARMRVCVTREDQQMTRVTEWFGISPGSIREDPAKPGLQYPSRATPGVKAFQDAVGALDSTHEHAFVTRDVSTFVLGSQPDGVTLPEDDESGPQDAVRVANCAWDENGNDEPRSTPFSLDYLTDIASAIGKSKADRLTVKWGHEIPAQFETEHEEWGFETSHMLAPRIQADD